MSEFGPTPEIEAQGLDIAREIGLLRSRASTDADYEVLTQKARKLKALLGVETTDHVATGILEAKRIFGTDVFGPEAIERTFGVKLEAGSVPEIPFSTEELERAQRLGQMLVLRVDKASDGQLLTMEKMRSLLQPAFDTEDKGQVLYDHDEDSWYIDEDFFKKETPVARWALVSKEVIPDSTNKNYLQQTERLVTYLQTEVFAPGKIPVEYQEAIEEFQAKKAAIEPLVDSDRWAEASQMLVDLKINQLVRQTPAEAMYDAMVVMQTSGADQTRLLENMYTWTSRRESDGGLVDFGYFDAEGADVGSWGPDESNPHVGVAFSRSR